MNKIENKKIKFFIIIATAGFFMITVSLFAEGIEKRKKFIYSSESRPDPFIPLLDSTGFMKEQGLNQQQAFDIKLEKIKVNGVFYDKAMPVVMINGKFFKKYDEILGVKILEINYDKIILGYGELKHEISLIEKKKIHDQGGISDGIF